MTAACGEHASRPEHLAQGLALAHGAPIKVFNAAGHVRLTAWDRDSLHISGDVGHGESFFLMGDAHGVKLGIMSAAPSRSMSPSTLVMFVPRSSTVAVKGASTELSADGVSGYFYTVSGAIRLTGRLRTIQAETMSGPISINGVVPWVRARSASGPIVIGGSVDDAAAATVTGDIALEAPPDGRTRAETMSGRVTVNAARALRGTLDVDTHSGDVVVIVPRTRIGLDIERVRPPSPTSNTNGTPHAEHATDDVTATFIKGSPDQPRVRVTTFDGGVRIRHAADSISHHVVEP